MLQSYQNAIEMLLNEDFHPGVSAEELETFKNQFRTSAYTCRLRSCPRATIGFETDLLRYEHEMAHAGGFRCTYSDCQYPPFPSSKALKAHVSSCHNIVPERKSIRRVGALGAPRSSEASPQIEMPPISATFSAPEVMEDSDEDLDLDEADFAESEVKFKKEMTVLEAKLVDLSARSLRATTPLEEIILLASITTEYLADVKIKDI